MILFVIFITLVATVFILYMYKTDEFKEHFRYHYKSLFSVEKNIVIKRTETTRSYDRLHLMDSSFYRVLDGRNVINKTQMKNVLFWDKYFGDTKMNLGLGKDIFKNCPVSTCMTTYNHSYMPIEDFDAVVFYGGRWKNKIDGTPPKRKSKQKYVFFTWESPYNTHFDEVFYNSHKHFYNWTLNFRSDSDIHFPYGVIQKKETNYVPPTVDVLKYKTVMAAWLVSNCRTPGTVRRTEYVEELQKYIQVDVYGSCGTMNCGDNCHTIIESKYFFYLSFENSMCHDYVTEKMYLMLNYNVVPVVLGFSDYETMAPPHSVIDTNKFPTPKLLAEYLIKLSKNMSLYLEYFEWKKHFVSVSSNEYALCQMCEMLHKPIEYSTYEDIIRWYFGFHCFT